ncbi:hypothetical protein [Psychrobacter sp. KH172YL61]|uniref:hypothetical protein n=1 Tax=Psychrobacter sp. KH172YL61 TaxID=2517899 RepID=UPI001F072F31|nr:hypothetical protein [Psychrobacter sp. KH172YL61]
MDSSTLPTQTDMDNTAITLDNKEEHSDIESESSTQTIDPNAIILAEALTDKAISWQIHNCKIIKRPSRKICHCLFYIIMIA